MAGYSNGRIPTSHVFRNNAGSDLLANHYTQMRDGYSILPPRYSDYCNDGNDYDPSDAMQYQAEMALWRFRASKLKLALFDALGDKSCQN